MRKLFFLICERPLTPKVTHECIKLRIFLSINLKIFPSSFFKYIMNFTLQVFRVKYSRKNFYLCSVGKCPEITPVKPVCWIWIDGSRITWNPSYITRKQKISRMFSEKKCFERKFPLQDDNWIKVTEKITEINVH